MLASKTTTSMAGSLIKKNPPMQKVADVISIKGKHGTIMFLDPRRVRPLPKQPRWETNPGFTEDSLRGLGRSIGATGQIESAKVCPLLEPDPDYDAQLIDGERRLGACKLEGVMLRVEVNEEVVDPKAIYLLSVVGNLGSEGHTCLEIAHIVGVFKKEYGMSIEEIANIFGGKSDPWVYSYLNILKLDPVVQELLVTPQTDRPVDAESTDVRRKKSRKARFALSFQLVNDLHSLPAEDQKKLAVTIVNNGMALAQARRHIFLHRNETGQHKMKKGRSKEHYDALQRAVLTAIDRLGIVEDMKPADILELLGKRDIADRKKLVTSIAGLKLSLETLDRLVKMSFGST